MFCCFGEKKWFTSLVPIWTSMKVQTTIHKPQASRAYIFKSICSKTARKPQIHEKYIKRFTYFYLQHQWQREWSLNKKTFRIEHVEMWLLIIHVSTTTNFCFKIILEQNYIQKFVVQHLKYSTSRFEIILFGFYLQDYKARAKETQWGIEFQMRLGHHFSKDFICKERKKMLEGEISPLRVRSLP